MTFRSALCLCLLALASAAHAVELAGLKTAIVYNLLLFVEWPPGAAPPEGGSLVLCVDAGTGMAGPMMALAGRPLGTRRLEVRTTQAAAESLRGCHAWYRDTSQGVPPAGLRLQAQQNAVLTISSDVRRDDDGTAIYLVESNGKMSFDVDAVTVRQWRLQISSKLLRLARKVYE